MTHLREPRFALPMDTARDELPRSKPYERNDLLNLVTPLKHVELCENWRTVASPIPGIDLRDPCFAEGLGSSVM